MKRLPASAFAPSARRSFRTALLLVAACLPVACSLPTAQPDLTRYFLLTAPAAVATPAEAAAAERTLTIGLYRVELPAYLRTPAIVVRPGGTEMRTAPGVRWGETLDQGIARVLRTALRAQPQVKAVTIYPTPHAGVPNCEVTVVVTSCEGVIGVGARFVADWEIRAPAPGGRRLAAGHFEPPAAAWDGSDYAALTAALGDAVGALGRDIGAALPP